MQQRVRSTLKAFGADPFLRFLSTRTHFSMSGTNTRLTASSQTCLSHTVNAQWFMEECLHFFHFFCCDYSHCVFLGLKDLRECLLEHDCWS